MIKNQCLLQTFSELSTAEKTNELDLIHDELLDQYGFFTDSLLFMPFPNGEGVPIGRTVASIGDRGVITGRISKRMEGFVEIMVNGEPFTANELYVSEVQ